MLEHTAVIYRQTNEAQPIQNRQSLQGSAEGAVVTTAQGHLDPMREAYHRSQMVLGLDRGVWIAAGLLTAWATMIHITVFHTPLHSLQAIALFWPMMQLHTG